jgi:hypothetical protein
MELIHENLLLVNLHMVYNEQLEPWIHKIFPQVGIVKFYCRLLAYEPILPPHRGRPMESWERTPYSYRNLRTDQLRKARDLAIKEADPTVPTVCMVEDFPYKDQFEKIQVLRPQLNLVIVDSKDLLLIDEEWVREQMPSVETIQIICRKWKFQDEFTTKWETFPCEVKIVSSPELDMMKDTLAQTVFTKPTMIFLEQTSDFYSSLRENASAHNNTQEVKALTAMEEVD